MATYNFGVEYIQDHIPGYDEDGFEINRLIEFWGVACTSLEGRVFAYGQEVYVTEAEANAALEAAQAYGSDPDNTPEAFHYVRTIYGSDAWGPEEEYELACFEADCYNEPRPVW